MVKEGFFTPNFALPFYHLSKEKKAFWYLRTYPGKEILLTSSLSIRSFSQLHEAVAYAFFDENLFALLIQTATREALYHFLLNHYFKANNHSYLQGGLFEEIIDQILNDPPAIYQQFVETADEEEIFIRCGVFKRVVPQIYDHTCCISGMHIISVYDLQMVDACHIVPFAVSHNDTISNGLSLSPTVHRAFDRGLISINSEYKVIVSDSFTENSSDSSIRVYEGKEIILPKDKSYHPSFVNLEWHRREVFKT